MAGCVTKLNVIIFFEKKNSSPLWAVFIHVSGCIDSMETRKNNLLNINHRELVAMEKDVIFLRPPTKRTQNKKYYVK